MHSAHVLLFAMPQLPSRMLRLTAFGRSGRIVEWFVRAKVAYYLCRRRCGHICSWQYIHSSPHQRGSAVSDVGSCLSLRSRTADFMNSRNSATGPAQTHTTDCSPSRANLCSKLLRSETMSKPNVFYLVWRTRTIPRLHVCFTLSSNQLKLRRGAAKINFSGNVRNRI